MRRVYNILVDLFGESKQGGYDEGTTQYQFNCPYCADQKGGIDGKFNLEISLSLGKFHCWSCGNAGPISRLIKSRGGKSLADEYFRIIKDIKESQYYNLEMFSDLNAETGETYLRLPKTFRKIDLDTCRDKKAVEYLKSRKITQDIIDYYNIGITTWDEKDWKWRNRIVFPSYDSNGDLNYFIGRKFLENDNRAKYQNTDIDKYTIIYHEDKIQWDADIYLVEGAIDCIYYPNTISMMGKAMSKDSALYKKLYNRANANIIICLDNDTDIKETKKIYKLLDHGRLHGKIKYIRLPDDDNHKDFGTVYEFGEKQEIIKIMKTVQQFDEIDLLI